MLPFYQRPLREVVSCTFSKTHQFSTWILLLFTLAHFRANSQCVKPNAGNDITICTASTQLVAPSVGQNWSFLSSSNGSTASVSAGGLATNMNTIGAYRFLLRSGQDATCSDTIIVTRANLTIATLPDNTICPGTTVTFGFQGLSNVDYLWSTGATTATISVRPTQTTPYTVVVTSRTSGCVARDTAVITVSPKPNAGENKIVCNNTTTVTPAGQGETWSFLSFTNPSIPAETATASITQQGAISGLTKAGFYRFVLRNGATCEDTIRIQRRLITLPPINLAPSCPGTTLTFGYTNITDFTYSWSTGDRTARISVAPTQNTNYIVEATETATGCTGTDTVKITLKPAPDLVLVSSVCSQNNSKYVTTITTTNGAVITSNAGTISGSGTSFVITVGADTSQYTITATLDGCRRRLVINKPDCNCPVISNPTAQAAAICAGTATTLTAAGCAAGTTVKWYSNVGLSTEVGSGNSFLTPNLIQNTDYYVACVSNANPICKSSGLRVTVSIAPRPSFNITAQNPACQGITPLNNGSVRITTAAVGNRYRFNTTGFGTLPTTATGSDTIKALPTTIAQNIANSTPSTTYYIRVFSGAGCSKDTSVTITPTLCQPNNCPQLRLIGGSADEACSGTTYLSLGAPMRVKTSTPSDSVRFVYFTAPTGTPYVGGTLIAMRLPASDSIATLGDNLPGFGRQLLPANTGTTPVTYYVYAILKNFPTNTTCVIPAALKTYTLNPLPKFTTEAVEACQGDSTFKVNVRITSSGSFKIVVATGITTAGSGSNPQGILQTINNASGSGAVTQLTLKTTGDFIIFVTDAKGCTETGSAPKPTFKVCNGTTYDLALSKSISKKKAAVGDNITYTLKVWNEGQGKATGVSVKDALNAGVVYSTHTTAFGNYNPTTKIWTIGELAVGDTVTLLISAKVVAQGVWFNTAEICTMNEKDEDSTPCNEKDGEDDLDRECFSVPISLCTGEEIEVRVPNTYGTVRWIKDNDASFTATGNTLLISKSGVYRFTATLGDCPAEGCCPIEVIVADCCPPDICVPFVIKQTKKGGKPIK
ncbi:MAG: DUF11 domain-containing protein [Cytophagia bacterium]|nr:MAG: DUF11 domain-containing protein [Runella sp.]TAG18441.1 MAG: DUF11 domain-containing protein [Cytophagales bacterium]TAG39736.1 MAG: DUF11 domain-containing protein [Cytophagia bacterium]TAG50917.1 MAG: DUF11 domain-containing protein [Runella slithyformis]TAG79275.1 MAG: DUF11 domain-containing protein [Cytophagales bacterium]